MHVEKNICDSLLGTTLGIAGKSKDTDNVRCDFTNLKIRPELHLYEEGNKLLKPQVEYTLTADECRLFCQWIKLVRFPDGFARNL